MFSIVTRQFPGSQHIGLISRDNLHRLLVEPGGRTNVLDGDRNKRFGKGSLYLSLTRSH